MLSRLYSAGAKVPQLLDSYESHGDCEPYLVLEFIEGLRFDKWLDKNAPVSFTDSLAVTRQILETIGLCHELNVGHRDLKPANIILYNNSPVSPYVIDFGVSFDSKQSICLTKEGEMFWNEFIILPECQDLEGGHRDLRSDITAVAGLLFSCLTGRPPIVLRDASGKAPHHKYRSNILASADSSLQGEQLLWVFERAFAYQIEDRFQNVEDFLRELDSAENVSTNLSLNLEDEFERFDQLTARKDRGVQLATMRNKYNKIIQDLMKNLSQRLNSEKPRGATIDVSQFNMQTLNKKYHCEVDNAELLSAGNPYIARISRAHYSQSGVVVMIPFAVGMDVHIYAASLVAGESNPVHPVSPNEQLKWEKILALEESMPSLSDDKLSAITQAVKSRLAILVRRMVIGQD